MSLSSKLRILIWFVMLIGGGILGFYLDSILFTYFSSNLIFHVITFLLGISLLSLVLLISKNTGRTLAKFGRKGEIKRMETNVLVTEGIYQYMRHPMHLGLLFFPMSFALILGSLSFILIIAPIEALFMLIMIKFVEEPEVIKKFGDDYLEYKKNVPFFCIKIKCLKKLLNFPA